MTFRSRIPKMITAEGELLRPFLNYQSRKLTKDVNDKQRTVIKFLLLEECAREKS
jgi:hypothetical protein